MFQSVSHDDSQSAITFFHEEIEEIEEIFNILRHKNSRDDALFTETVRLFRIKCH